MNDNPRALGMAYIDKISWYARKGDRVGSRRE
jgi:hypothetical protein